jgi:hypothetical protein
MVQGLVVKITYNMFKNKWNKILRQRIYKKNTINSIFNSLDQYTIVSVLMK